MKNQNQIKVKSDVTIRLKQGQRPKTLETDYEYMESRNEFGREKPKNNQQRIASAPFGCNTT